MTSLLTPPGESLGTTGASGELGPPLCRGCGAKLSRRQVVADLGTAPLANHLLSADCLDQLEIHRRLLVLICDSCLLVQLPQSSVAPPELLFPDAYPFRSGSSVTWLAHCREFADSVSRRLGLGSSSRVLEIGSNDGTGLLRFRALGIPAMGVEPCREVALEAAQSGVSTLMEWWTEDFAQTLSTYDLVIARNVLAHVPDLGDFLRGVWHALKPGGRAVFEVPYVANLLQQRQWDQIYHEHHCYFSVQSLNSALRQAGLVMEDVEQVLVHGGSLRVYARRGHESSQGRALTALKHEMNGGLGDVRTYTAFADKPALDKRCFLRFLLDCKEVGHRIMGYGASAKAITLLNYCGIGPELIESIVDTTPAKQGRYTPGRRVPILAPWALQAQPDLIVNFLWNWRAESEAHIHASYPDTHIVYLHHMP